MVALRANSEVDEIVEPILKYIIVAFNLLTFCFSILSIIGGSWLIYVFDQSISDDKNFSSVYDLTFDIAVYLLIIGVIGILITSLAIAATYRENVFVLRLYMIILTLIVVMNLVTGVTFLIFSGKITQTITEKLQGRYITDYFEDDLVRSVYDTLQSGYKCCGIKDYNDWNSNPYFNCTSTTSSSSLKCLVPASCCIGYTSKTNQFCSGNVLADKNLIQNIHYSGCSNEIIDAASFGISVVSGCCIGLSVIMAINVALVQWLIILVNKEKALYNAKYRSDDYKKLENEY